MVSTGTEMFGSINKPKKIDLEKTDVKNEKKPTASPIIFLGVGVALVTLMYYAGKKVEENV